MNSDNFDFYNYICPFCGGDTVFHKSVKITRDMSKLFEEIETFDLLVQKQAEKLSIEYAKEIVKEIVSDQIKEVLGNSVSSLIIDEYCNISFEYSWIYIKLWQERSWVALKYGKTNNLENRQKGYDDHDYVLNLCVPVPAFVLSTYEEFLGDYVANYLIPFILGHKEKRIKKLLEEDFETVELNKNSGIAPGRKEYWRLFIRPSSDEFDFLVNNLKSFFYALSRPGWPIEYDKWVILKEKIENNQNGGNQLSLF